jgi:hypothetical protein
MVNIEPINIKASYKMYDGTHFFNNVEWENVENSLKDYWNLTLYGGSNNRKYLLRTVQANLSYFFINR